MVFLEHKYGKLQEQAIKCIPKSQHSLVNTALPVFSWEEMTGKLDPLLKAKLMLPKHNKILKSPKYSLGRSSASISPLVNLQ